MIDFEKYLLLSTFLLLIIFLIIDKWKPSLLFGGASILLLSFGILTPTEFLSGFANESIITIFFLLALTSILNEYFNISYLFNSFLKNVKTTKGYLLKMGAGVSVLSSFINNTPIVAMLLPIVYEGGKKRNISPSLLLIPLSYITVLGGMITVIGTSTNLVLNGLIVSKGLEPLTTIDYFIPGTLATVIGVLFISLMGYKLLPKNKDVISEAKANLKEYIVETEIEANSKLIRKSVIEAGLRNLDGIFLIEIIRNNSVISPVEPNEMLLGNDRLFFVGETDKIINLINQERGLLFPQKSNDKHNQGLEIVETVIPANSELVGRSLKEFQFRDKYDAAVIAIHRNGERVRGKIGEVILDKGDLLMLSVGKNFDAKQKFDTNFYLISILKRTKQISKHKKYIIQFCAAFFLLLTLLGQIKFFVFLVLILTVFTVLGYIDFEQLKKQLNLELFSVLGCSIAISTAIVNSSLTKDLEILISKMIDLNNPSFSIVLIYFITVFITSFITNTATVAIIFPIGFALIGASGINPNAIFLAISFGASCCFLTPIGYQTNLMVQGPGNYKFVDYFKLGIPLTIIYSTLVLTWIIYYYL